MSLSFRPVREEWGEACSCFVDAITWEAAVSRQQLSLGQPGLKAEALKFILISSLIRERLCILLGHFVLVGYKTP
jgi:hypothetical protein